VATRALLPVGSTRPLAEDPELVGAAASATLLAVENGHLEGELRASRTRILEAGDAERRRIERDLHDGAQQRLVALRIRLGITSEQSDDPGQRAMLERFGDEVEETIDDLRNLAHGVYPQVLVQARVGARSPRSPGTRRPLSGSGTPESPATPRRSR
jgi:signal transduction histidine kinase